jgi:hypothetical protein
METNQTSTYSVALQLETLLKLKKDSQTLANSLNAIISELIFQNKLWPTEGEAQLQELENYITAEDILSGKVVNG